MCNSCSLFSAASGFLFIFVIIFVIITTLKPFTVTTALVITTFMYFVLLRNSLTEQDYIFGSIKEDNFTPLRDDVNNNNLLQEDESIYMVPNINSHYNVRDPFNRDYYNKNKPNSDDSSYYHQKVMSQRYKENMLNSINYGKKLSPFYSTLLDGNDERDWWENY